MQLIHRMATSNGSELHAFRLVRGWRQPTLEEVTTYVRTHPGAVSGRLYAVVNPTVAMRGPWLVLSRPTE